MSATRKKGTIMDNDLIKLTRHDSGVTEVILNNPTKKNAMNAEMMRQLYRAVIDLEDDDSTRAIVIRGEGGCFCSGGDLSGTASGKKKTIETSRENIGYFGRVVTAIQNCEKPFIAQVDGYAMGGGFSLALACDMIYASPETVFSSNFLHVALAPEMGSMVFLSQACGVYRAKELWYSGRKVSGEEGQTLGFVSKLVPGEDLYDTTLADATRIAQLPRTPVRIMKSVVNTHVLSDVPAVVALDRQDSPLCFSSEEGLAYLGSHFLKK